MMPDSIIIRQKAGKDAVTSMASVSSGSRNSLLPECEPGLLSGPGFHFDKAPRTVYR